MQAIIFALLAYFSWGVGILFEAIAAKKLDSKSFIFWGMLLGFFLIIFYTPFTLSSLKNLTIGLLAVNLLVAFFWISGTTIYYKALKEGNPTLVGTIASSFPMVTVILSVILFQEKLNFFQTTAIIIIFLGLILSSLEIKSLMKREFKISDKGILLALLTMLVWGATMTLIKIPVREIGWYWPTLIILSLFPLYLLYMRLTNSKLQSLSKSKVVGAVILSVILIRIAEFSYSIGISKGMVSVVAPIAGANPTLFVLLAFFVFKDRLTKQQILGIVLTLLGIV